MTRIDKRKNDELRSLKIQPDYLFQAKGSVLIEQGKTRVLCAVSVIPGRPKWMDAQKIEGGWLTGEYQMLPASTNQRTSRDITRGRMNGRSQEIQRLIGRSLRAVVDLQKIGHNTIYVDCDVIDADGGTRCASISGASVALHIAFSKMIEEKTIPTMPMTGHVAGISVGIKDGTPILDLCYEEDSCADVDMNIIMTEAGQFVEIQGTAESGTFSRSQMDLILNSAQKGIEPIFTYQNKITQS